MNSVQKRLIIISCPKQNSMTANVSLFYFAFVKSKLLPPAKDFIFYFFFEEQREH